MGFHGLLQDSFIYLPFTGRMIDPLPGQHNLSGRYYYPQQDVNP
jgi:hypothetical protein